jgi:hypothetical protein
MKPRVLSVLLVALLGCAIATPAFADFPEWTPPWYGNPGYFGAVIWWLEDDPGADMKWDFAQHDAHVPGTLPSWMTDNPENTYCDFSDDFPWLVGATIGGRTGNFPAFMEVPPGAQLEVVIGLDNTYAALKKDVFVAFDVWTQLENWDVALQFVEAMSSHGPGNIWIVRWEDPQAGGWRQLTILVCFDPQPDWEWIRVVFNAAALEGSTLAFDNACIASLCHELCPVESASWGRIKAMYRQ